MPSQPPDSAPAARPVRFPNPRPAVPRDSHPLCVMVIDAEEDFDWDNPVAGVEGSTWSLRFLRDLQALVGAWGVVPTYMLTYPVLEDADAVRLLRRQRERGECVLGLQLHPWVTPPLEGPVGRAASFSANLPAALEERKLLALADRFEACFGERAVVYRAGRYGLSPPTPAMLERLGLLVDTSVAPRTSFAAEGGPDYTGFDCDPFWFGERRRLLEVPLCRSVVGWAGGHAAGLYRALSAPALARLRVPALLTRAGCAERVTLSPEGNDAAAMRRLLGGLLRGGRRVFSLSFHSSSLAPGRNPYVRSRADLHGFYDRLSATLDHLDGRLGARFADLASLPGLLREAGPAAGPPS